MKQKKFFAFLAILVIASMVLAACASTQPVATDAPPAETEEAVEPTEAPPEPTEAPP